MKASKFIVLVGGILGVLAFFLPLVTVEHGGAKASVSAFQIIKGLDVVSAQVDGQELQVATAGMSSAAESKGALDTMKGIVMAVFVPALLLTLCGGLAARSKRFGRGVGFLCLALGLVGIGIGAILDGATEGQGGIGLTLLLVSGVAGAIGGLLALIKPERRLAAAAA